MKRGCTIQVHSCLVNRLAHRNVTLKPEMIEVEIRLDYLELETLGLHGTNDVIDVHTSP